MTADSLSPIDSLPALDFTDAVTGCLDGYRFNDDDQKAIFLSTLIARLSIDEYLWHQIVETIAMTASDIAEQMNIPEID